MNYKFAMINWIFCLLRNGSRFFPQYLASLLQACSVSLGWIKLFWRLHIRFTFSYQHLEAVLLTQNFFWLTLQNDTAYWISIDIKNCSFKPLTFEHDVWEVFFIGQTFIIASKWNFTCNFTFETKIYCYSWILSDTVRRNSSFSVHSDEIFLSNYPPLVL